MATELTITPSAGNAPFPTQGGVGADPGFDAIDFRRFWSRVYVEGVSSAGAWKVSESATLGLTVTVAADVDAAFVQGDSVADQGLYYVAPNSGALTLDVAAPDATNPRVDSVVLQVYDSDHDGSGEYAAKLRVLTGTPAAGATLDNQSGAPALPDTALLLAQFRVSPGDVAVTNVNVRDYRDYALRDGLVGEVRFIGNDDAIPDGWVAADGAVVNRVQFARAFAALSTKHGIGDGSLTFGLPDAQGRHLVGKGTHADVDTVGKDDGEAVANRTPKHKHYSPWPFAQNGGAGNFVAALRSGAAALTQMGYALRGRISDNSVNEPVGGISRLNPGGPSSHDGNLNGDPFSDVAQYFDVASTTETAGFLTMQAVVFVGSVATPA